MERLGNSSGKWARSTLGSDTRRFFPPHNAGGRGSRRGKARGTLMMAMLLERPSASCPPSLTMKFSDLLAT